MPDVPDNLSSFLGLDYHLRYIPLLCKCGLVKERVVKGEKTYMVCQTASAGGYCWSAFFAEFNLNDFEIAILHQTIQEVRSRRSRCPTLWACSHVEATTRGRDLLR
jgi:hypothetical protein